MSIGADRGVRGSRGGPSRARGFARLEVVVAEVVSRQIVGEQVVAQVVAGGKVPVLAGRTGPATRSHAACKAAPTSKRKQAAHRRRPARPGPERHPAAGRPRLRCGAPCPSRPPAGTRPAAGAQRSSSVCAPQSAVHRRVAPVSARSDSLPAAANHRAPARPGAVRAPVGQTSTHCPQKVQPELAASPASAAPADARRSSTRCSDLPRTRRDADRPARTGRSPRTVQVRAGCVPSPIASRTAPTARRGSVHRGPRWPPACPARSARARRSTAPRAGWPYVHWSRLQPSRSGQLRQTWGCRARIVASRSSRAALAAPGHRWSPPCPASPVWTGRPGATVAPSWLARTGRTQPALGDIAPAARSPPIAQAPQPSAG